MAKHYVPHEPSYSISEFCIEEGISEPTYYKLKKQGLAPEEIRYPGVAIVRITYAARMAWQQRMQNPTGEQAEVVRRIAASMLEKSHSAVNQKRDRRNRER